MYRVPAIFISFFPLIVSAFNSNQALSTLVTDARTNVTYLGISQNGVESFLNIHYGLDTAGAARFAPPVPFIPARNTVINATVKGAACPQPSVPFPGLNGVVDNVTDISEDCLTLRIARPVTLPKHAKLPVMVWIYGGVSHSVLFVQYFDEYIYQHTRWLYFGSSL
jgi:hypothetical protein